MNRKFSIVFSIVVLFFSKNTTAQNLIVALDFGILNSFPIANIQSIKFGLNTMTVKENNGTIFTWNLQNVHYYYFDSSSGIEETIMIEDNAIKIYPNPATSDLNIEYKSNDKSLITIEIVDIEGKRLSEIFTGIHQGNYTYNWNENLSNGLYYCRISTNTRTISKPFIVTQ